MIISAGDGWYEVAAELSEVKEAAAFIPLPDGPETPRFRLLISICVIFVAGVGLISLLGWALDMPVLASLGSGKIPVAPSTAVMFVLFAGAILLRIHLAYLPVAARAGMSIIIAGGLLATLLFVLSLLNIRLEAEHIGFVVVNRPGELQAGHMSPVTSFCFLLSSLSYLMTLSRSVYRRQAANIAWWMACSVIAIASMLVLAYLYGTPILYGSEFIPPAALTSLAFIALGAALLSFAAPRAWLSHPHADATTRTSYAFLMVFVILAAGIVFAGYLYYHNYEMRHRNEVEHQLTAVADLKVDGIVNWRKERMGDAALFYKNLNFSGLVARYIQTPQDRESEGRLRTWLEHIQSSYQYDRIFLLDADGRELMAMPQMNRPISRRLILRSSEVRQNKEVVFEDIYRNEHDNRIYLAMLVPILEQGAQNRVIATLVFRINPEQYFYPFINRWPTGSETAETLLVRREGNEVLFLNELRFQKNTALNLRRSLDQKDLPAAQAALGRKGIIEGKDYRGVHVIADLRPVPGTPWFLVSRMDQSEVYGPLREKLWTTILLVMTLLISAGAAFWLVWRQQLSQFYLAKYEAAEALCASEVRYRRLFEAAKDGILVLDAETGMVVDVNPFLIELLGYSEEEFLGKKVWELGFFKDIVSNQANFEELQQKEFIRYEDKPLETSDGRRIEVEFISSVYLSNRRRVIQCNIRDITERKRVEHKLNETLADLQRSNKELEQFAYVASHDLQEPLRMVASYTQLLGDRYENQLDEKAKKYIHYAVDGAVRMQLLINDLLAYSRIGTRGKPLAPVDAHAALGEAIRNLKMQIDDTLAIITNDVLPEVNADASQLVQLFQNLIANAVKFHGEAPPRIHVSVRDQGREWLFAVSDNGIGIDPQYADKVFVIFQRLHTREEYPGSGIGLAICKKIVERHGGRIWFESEPGKGSTFYFTILKS